MFLLAALAVVAVFGLCGAAYAESPLHAIWIGPSRAAVTDNAASTVLFQLATGASNNLAPDDGAGGTYWPCFTGYSNWPDCVSIPAGGVVIGQPSYTQSLSNCATGAACLWVYWFVEDDVTSTKPSFNFSVTITQGSSTILQTGMISGGANAPGIYIVSGNIAVGPGNCATATCVAPVAGPATITTVTAVGKQKVAGKATINFE